MPDTAGLGFRASRIYWFGALGLGFRVYRGLGLGGFKVQVRCFRILGGCGFWLVRRFMANWEWGCPDPQSVLHRGLNIMDLAWGF